MRMSNVSSADIDADPNANSNYVAVAELTASDNEVSKDGCARGHTKRSEAGLVHFRTLVTLRRVRVRVRVKVWVS